MEYRPGDFPATHNAARTAPVAKARRSNARWVSAMCSVPDAKINVCSPTT